MWWRFNLQLRSVGRPPFRGAVVVEEAIALNDVLLLWVNEREFSAELGFSGGQLDLGSCCSCYSEIL